MTSDCEPAGAGESSSSCTSGATCRLRPLRALPVALRAELRDVPDLREAIFPLAVSDDAEAVCEFRLPLSVYRLVFAARSLVVVPRTFHERPQIVERDATVDLGKRPLDDVLEVRGAQRTTPVQRE